MHVTTRIRIAKEKNFLGKGVRELLDAIEAEHSIKQATLQTGISYPKALRMIHTLEEELGFAVVISEKGGSTHGSTCLTPQGKEVLENYRTIEHKVEQYAQQLVNETFLF
ncbi:MAG: LysR family transcriptional regulator [Lachnospiraceae bacterium]